MKNIRNFIITSLLWTYCCFSVQAQNNTGIDFLTDGNGYVKYEMRTDNIEDVYTFTLFGDGTFSTQKNPGHIFEPSTTGYTTETYFARAYDPNLPPKETIDVPPFTATGTPNPTSFTNPTIQMTNDIHLMTSWATAYGYENYYIIAFTNTTSQTPIDGCIEFYYNDAEIDINFPNIEVYNNWVTPNTISSGTPTLNNNIHNYKISWQFTGLQYNEMRYVYIPAVTKTAIGEELDLRVKYNIHCKDRGKNTDLNYEFLTRRYPHDPNFKIVNKSCIKEGISDKQELIYTIGFFNDGEYFAQDVYVKDQLASAFDKDNIRLIDYEVQPTWLEDNGILYFNFLNINLPGTNQTIPYMYTYDDASTYFSFKICTKSNLVDCIKNQASIVFDTQPVFYTNVSKICIMGDCPDYDVCSIDPNQRNQAEAATQFEKTETQQEFQFTAFPNPATDALNLNINFSTQESSDFTIKLLDFSGRVIKEFDLQKNDSSIFTKTIDIKNLSSGLYFITLKTYKGIYTKKVIKN
ncbi:T9SS type A sorting domain-containing protein [uncultured Kordia sp.]|uniref:T9SS type A sorting domain-containing protein n=1 Tax=uncultured Kordia sp. TaxID=507699 RepID=UPI00260E261B|nr:T9SS type A sorting domain-containing protein [uncultured Kordia sp.]